MATRARAVSSTAALALACLLALGATASEAQPDVQNVLILQSLNRGNLTLDSFTSNFRVELDRQAGKPMNVVQVTVGPTGSVRAPDRAVLDYIRSLFAGQRPPDLIVTTGGPAAVFARKYRQQLFPDTPLLLASVDQRYVESAPLGVNETTVAAENNFSLIIEDILQLLPATRRVFMVTGSGEIGRFWHRQFEKDFQRFDDRLTFLWSDELSLPEILRRCASLPRDSAIFYLVFSTDAAGAAYADDRVLADLHATANAPVFGAHSVMLGYGVVGGRLLPIETIARNSADVAVRILNGAPPASVRVPLQTAGNAVFDWRELKRWGIPRSRLPAGSVVRFRGPSPLREYRVPILITLCALLIQSALILGLIFERRARRRAEIESRRNLALAADVSRRQTMSALTSSIAHELGQPLNSMIFNAQALQMMLTGDRANADITEILSDIQAQGESASEIIHRHRTMLRSRAVEKKPINLHDVIEESLALVAHDMKEKQIEASVDLSASPCVVSGDEVLLQQVVVNLVLNAMDAMEETPPARRRVTIRSRVSDAEIEASVRDMGPGLPPQIAGNLFTPFVTTKAHGLGIGLTIARSIVDAHGGTIHGQNHPEGGATFTVRLPCNRMSHVGAPGAA